MLDRWTKWLPDWPVFRRLRGGRNTGLKWVRGEYAYGLEVSSFRPVNSAERWWTSFMPEIAGEATVLMEHARGAPVPTELRGEVSASGSFGHLGMYERTFVVHEIGTFGSRE